MVGLVALLLLSLLLYQWIKGKMMDRFNSMMFSLDFVISCFLTIGFVSFFLWKAKGTTLENYQDFLLNALYLFLIFALTGVKAWKTQLFVIILLFAYALTMQSTLFPFDFNEKNCC